MNTQSQPALTHEELKQHADFVYRCVMDNTVLDAAGRAGLSLRMTVQELVHSNVATLRKIGGQIEEIANKAGSSRFSTTGPHRISGVESSKWIDFLALQIKLKQVEEAEVDKARKLKDLEAQLEQFKTPGEKRTEIEQSIAALKGEALGTPSIATT